MYLQLPCIMDSPSKDPLGERHHSHNTDIQQSRCSCSSKGKVWEKWCWRGNQFGNILNHRDWAPQNNCWVCRQGLCSAKHQYAFHFSDRINTREANDTMTELQWSVHYKLLLVEDMQYLITVMPNRTHGMMMCRDAPQRVRLIVDVSSFLTPIQLVPSSEDNHYLPNQNASLDWYNMIY